MEKIFYEMFDPLPQQGPGNFQSTQKALEAIGTLPENPRILDVGCGSGTQTLALAKLTKAEITALDNYQSYLDNLSAKATYEGVADRICCVNGDMAAMKFDKESFDLIWSEGAIYIIGFEKGLKEWQQFLRAKGYIAVSEVTWIKENPPDTLRDFWEKEYPGINDVATNLNIIDAAGYDLITHFTLPESAWWDDYYTPLEMRIEILKKKYPDNQEAQELFNLSQLEIDMYRKYSDYYGYVFYVMQRKS